MAYLPNFEYDIFISYSHVDNRPLSFGQRGWISAFHEMLETRLDQVLDADASVWRDERMPGNEHFDDSLPDRVSKAAILVSVVSPRYLQSEWCIKELQVFCRSADATGGLRIGDRSRIFKVIKDPVPSPEPIAELRGTVGYEFFEVEKGIPHVLDPDVGEQARVAFRKRVDDVAYHIRELLKLYGGDRTVVRQVERPVRAVYLAETTWDLREEREAVRRELRQRGFRVLPEEPLPHTPEFRDEVREQLRQCELSVHMIGQAYGVVPEQETSSIAAIQYSLAGERSGNGRAHRIVWVAGAETPTDDRQKEFLRALRNDPTAQEDTDILENAGVEDLKTTIQDVLDPATRRMVPPPPPGSQVSSMAYLICDPVDVDACLSIRDFLMAQGLDATLPLIEGEEAEIRDEHHQNLVGCDAALVFWGRAGEAWVRTQLREILKAPGYGRPGPIPVQGLLFGAPDTPAKERFRTLQALMMRDEGGDYSSTLRPFMDRLLNTR